MMKIIDRHNMPQIFPYIEDIKEDPSNWVFSDIRVSNKSEFNAMLIARQMQTLVKDEHGVLFIPEPSHLIAFIRKGVIDAEVDEFGESLSNGFKGYDCDCFTTEITKDGIRKLQIRLVESSMSMDAAEASSSSLQLIRKSRGGNIILIVDDDKFVADLVQRTVKSYGQCRVVSDAQNAVDAYLKFVPDMVFLDINMPKKNGLTLLKEIRAYDKDAHVVMLTGEVSQEQVQTAKKHGAVAYVAKPFNATRLVSEVRRCKTIK